MLEVHTSGKGTCGVFTFEIAEIKVAQITTYARQHQYPLAARKLQVHQGSPERQTSVFKGRFEFNINLELVLAIVSLVLGVIALFR